MFQTILITGASSGIGEALAEYYASPSTRIIITGRDEMRLKSALSKCKAKGADVITKVIDVTDKAAMEKWLNKVDADYPIDLLVANAGIRSPGRDPDRSSYDLVFETNLGGVLNTVWPVMQRMKERKSGYIAVVSSLTAYRGYPLRGAYSASKAAVKMLCECWRIELEPYNITVSTICPGFVKTPLTAANKFKMPMLMETDEAARRIAKGIAKKKAVIVFPLLLFLIVRILQCLPVFISDFIVRTGAKGTK